MASADEFKIAKLTSENYHAWTIRTKAALVQKGCWEAVDPGYAGIEMTNDEKKTNNKALTFLFLVVEDSYLDDIGACTQAREAWEILHEMHTKYGLLHILQLLRDFVNVRMKREEPMKEYLSRLMDLHRKLSNAGYGFSDKEVALVTLMGLPESYEPLILKFEQDEGTLTTKEVKARLLVEEKRKLRRNEEQMTDPDGEEKALLTKNKSALKPVKTRQDDRRNHPTGRRNRGSHPVTKRRVRCFACGKFGHIAKYCEADSDDEASNYGERGCVSFAGKVIHKALCATSHTAAGSHAWYLDSGATDHMTSDRTKLRNFQSAPSTLEMANKEVVEIIGKGEAEFELAPDNGGKSILLKDVLYVPELDGNLLSVGRIEELGFSVVFDNGRAEVRERNGALILTANRRGRLYPVNEKRSASKLSKTLDASLLHRRLGHLNLEAVRHTFGGAQSKKDKICSICLLGKLKRKSFPNTVATSQAKSPLDLVHSDVGSVTPTSKGGSKYFVTFIDDHTRYTVVYPMKKKSDVLEKFVLYKRMVENFHGSTIKTLRSDNGGEYVGKDFVRYLQKYGIRRELTVPGTPQQNGVAERMNRTLLDMTRCLLIESGLPKTLWADALVTACYIRNKCPSSSIDGQVPETLWTGRDAIIDHMRVYGCKAWAAQKRHGKTKLDPKAVECVFVGYPEGVKAYKLWNRENDSFFVSRDVVFDENSFPCKKSDTVDKLETSHERVLNERFQSVAFSFDDLAEDNETTSQPNTTRVADENPSVDHPENVSPGREPTRGGGANHSDDHSETVSHGSEQLLRDATPILRRSERLASKPRPNYSCCVVKKSDFVPDPKTVEEALSAPDGHKWREAIQEELTNLKTNGTWDIVPRPAGRRVVKCKWVLRKKYKQNGDLERYKARLVACGYSQVEGIDFKETFSPVIKLKSLRILLALAVERSWPVHQIDITAAYLNGSLDETIFMEQPAVFCEGSRDDVCLLKKSLYGLRQSGRQWNVRLDEFLKKEGLTRSKADPCVYFDNEKNIIVGVYVDDIVIIAESEEKIKLFKGSIGGEFEVKDLGEAHHILSMGIRRHGDGSLTLDQTGYAEEIVDVFGMGNARGASTPLDPGMKLKRAPQEAHPSEDLSRRYRQAVGGLLYLAGGTRPDLAFSASYLSQFNEHPTVEHWNGVKHVLRYIKQTKKYALTYTKTGKVMQAFCDADWASDKVDRRSFSGYAFILAGAAISWSSRKQRSTALSTVEAEYLAMCEAAKEVLWLQHFAQELGALQYVQEPHLLHVDNQGAIAVATNQITSERNKHIELRHFFLREKVEEGKIQLQYVRTSENTADILTKVLNGEKTRELCDSLGLRKDV